MTISNRPFGSKPSALDPLVMEYIFWLSPLRISGGNRNLAFVDRDDSNYHYQEINHFERQSRVHRTSVVIIGGGPAGMLLSHILSEHGIDNVVLEKHTRDHVLSRIRAGVWSQVLSNYYETLD